MDNEAPSNTPASVEGAAPPQPPPTSAPTAPAVQGSAQVVDLLSNLLKVMPASCRLEHRDRRDGLFVTLDASLLDQLQGLMPPTTHATAELPRTAATAGPKLKVLVADDDRVACQLLRTILAREPNYEVVCASDGLSAWEMIEGGLQPDLCVLDINMPRMDGLQLLEKMRHQTRLSATPVIICSAYKDRDTVTRAARLHVNYYLVKPFSKETVLTELRKAAATLAPPAPPAH